MPDLLIPINLDNPDYALTICEVLAEFAARAPEDFPKDGAEKCTAFVRATLDMGSDPNVLDPWGAAKVALAEMLLSTMGPAPTTEDGWTANLSHGRWEEILAIVERPDGGALQIVIGRNVRQVGIRCTDIDVYQAISTLGAVLHNLPNEPPRYDDEVLYRQMQELCAEALQRAETGAPWSPEPHL